MSPESNFCNKLQQVYLGQTKEVTPHKTELIIEKNQLLNRLSGETGILDTALLARLFHPDGRFYSDRYNKFQSSLDELKKTGQWNMLSPFLDDRCVYKEGGISIRRLRKNRKEEKKNFEIIERLQ
jgi:hypothetical protein